MIASQQSAPINLYNLSLLLKFNIQILTILKLSWADEGL